MAYGTKYKFKFESEHGTTYEVRLQEQDYSGTVKTRPLGSAPVIRMQEADPFRSTCCELVLECREDEEFVDLYTTNPRQYRVQVYRGTSSLLWTGFVVTELYSEPDIAPPYDVKITATDGLGTLKEYDFEPWGAARTVRTWLQTILAKTGLTIDLHVVSTIREYGDTAITFLDETYIDLDYHEGDSYYDALEDLLKTLHVTLTQWRGAWLMIRETDIASKIKSNGDVTVIDADYRGINIYEQDMDEMTATVGKMGVGSNLWPIGYLTRSVSPAKKSVTVISEWHPKNGAPALADWYGVDSSMYVSNLGYWQLGYQGGTGTIAASMNLTKFVYDVKVTIKAIGMYWGSLYPPAPYVKVLAAWTENGSTYYYDIDAGWGTSSVSGEELRLDRAPSSSMEDPNLAQTVEVTIPHYSTVNSGYITINVVGHLADVFEVKVEILAGGGYKDTISMNNDARGSAGEVNISGGRELSTALVPIDFFAGVFYTEPTVGNVHIITSFQDNDNSQLDYMSLTALNYAKSVAAPRIEITGTIDMPAARTFLPLLIKSHNVWALMQSYDWNLKEDELNFKAVTLPSVTINVASETITTIPKD